MRRRMGRRNRRRNKNLLFTAILLLVLVGGLVGYASLHETLIIEGDTTVAKNVWDVRFNNVQVLDNNAQVETAPQIIDNESKVNFVIKLDKPGDSYSFTVDVVNNGDIDAMIGTKSLVDGLAAKTNYLDYQLSYIDGVEIEEKNLLKKGEKDTIKFSVKFKKDITASDLETAAEQSLTITLTSTYVQADSTATERNRKACIKATTLHTEECERTDEYGCAATGYTANGLKETTTVTYGHTDSTRLTNGQLTNGQSQGYALDCDLNGNGVVDTDASGNSTERFYYVSDLYTGTTNNIDQFDNDYAVLIYYKNYGINYYYKNSTAENWHGPVTLANTTGALPERTDWINPKIGLKSTTRNIYTETGTNTTSGGTIENPFVYTNKVARLLTTHEIAKALNSTSRTVNGYLDNAEYLMEDSYYTKASGCSGGSCIYWLETPSESYSIYAWRVNGDYRFVYYRDVNYNHGSRPVIEIPKTEIYID